MEKKNKKEENVEAGKKEDEEEDGKKGEKRNTAPLAIIKVSLILGGIFFSLSKNNRHIGPYSTKTLKKKKKKSKFSFIKLDHVLVLEEYGLLQIFGQIKREKQTRQTKQHTNK